jgi:cystathionine beta-lyase/cystathionine gamma-synthase
LLLAILLLATLLPCYSATCMRKISTRRTPIYRDAGFVFDSIEQSKQAFTEEQAYPQSSKQFIYTRYGNPTVIETEQAIAKIEGSAWAILTASGMAAIDVALALFHQREQTGTWLFSSEIYGGTNTYITQVLEQRRGIQIERFAPQRGKEKYALAELIELLDQIHPQLLYFEPVSNPLLIVADGNEIIKIAKARGIRVIVDNTFATPYLWRPLQDGADLVIHSATKYLSGHGNITAGVVCGNDAEFRKEAMLYRKLVGLILGPDDAYRLGTQIKTFELRVSRQCENAYKLAYLLTNHPKIKNVRYPGLPSHVTHQEAVNIFGDKGFGAMVTFELKGGREACDIFIEKIAPQVKYVPTLGDPDSILIHVPTVFTEERFPYPGMIRFSVGFEDYQTLETSILKALEAI